MPFFQLFYIKPSYVAVESGQRIRKNNAGEADDPIIQNRLTSFPEGQSGTGEFKVRVKGRYKHEPRITAVNKRQTSPSPNVRGNNMKVS